MKLLWIALAACLALPGSALAAPPDHCPPQKAKVVKTAHKPRHHHRKHHEEPRYYEDEYAPLPPPPPPPPPPRAHIWHDGYGKPYAMGPRPWAARRPAPARRIIVAGCRISAVSTSGTASTIITGWNPDFNKYDRLGLILRRIR